MATDCIHIIEDGKKTGEINYANKESYAFKFDIDDGEIYFSDAGRTHSSINFDGILHGRIWTEHKIIGFWSLNFSDIKIIDDDTTTKDNDVYKSNNSNFTFQETLDIIEDNFQVVDFSSGWLIDVPSKWSEYNETTYEEYDVEWSLLPIEDFKKIEVDNHISSDIEKAKDLHLMNAKEKQAYYKKHGKAKGFGSDKTSMSSKNPIAWRQAKMRSEKMELKYLKYFNRI